LKPEQAKSLIRDDDDDDDDDDYYSNLFEFPFHHVYEELFQAEQVTTLETYLSGVKYLLANLLSKESRDFFQSLLENSETVS